MKNDRLSWVDQCRGFAILLVVVGHLIHFNGFGQDNPLAEIIWTFHMPLFFAISGYVAEMTTHITKNSEYWSFTRKKIIAIGFPWIIWGLFISKWVFKSQWPIYTSEEVLGFWNSTYLWFFGALLWIILIYGVHKLCYSKLQGHLFLEIIVPFIITGVFTFIIVYLKIRSLDIFLWSIGFYTGVLLRRYQLLYKFCSQKKIVVLALLFFLIFSGHWCWFGSYIDDIYKITCSTAAIIVLFYFFENQHELVNSKIAKMLEVFGIHSLAIYVLQFYMAGIVHLSLRDLDINMIILFLITSIIAIVICYVCVWIARYIQCFPILDLFLLGNHRVHLFSKVSSKSCKK